MKALAGLVCVGVGVAVLHAYGPYWLFALTALVCGPIIGHCLYVRIKKGYWPEY